MLSSEASTKNVDLTLCVCCYIKPDCMCTSSFTQTPSVHLTSSTGSGIGTSIGMCSRAPHTGYLCSRTISNVMLDQL